LVSGQTIADVRGERPFDAAPSLWVAGSLEGLRLPCVAVVGTRAATAAGKRLARSIAAELAAAGCCIVSGLALGIDAAAHEGALDRGAVTIGVLGGGHDCFFPPRNAELAERMIAGGGAVLSPFEPACPAQPWQFLARNGVVAGLSDAVLVVEAPARSGALNTAGWAAGRVPVLAIPGDVDRRHVQGCLALIRDGAILARHAADVLDVIGVVPRPGSVPDGTPARERRWDPVSTALMDRLSNGPASLDELIAASLGPAPAALAALTQLELDGFVTENGTSTYARACREGGTVC
jgi:DNA processing protein